MSLDAVSTHRILVNLWKFFLMLVGGLFALRHLKRGLYRALVVLQCNGLFSVSALHAIGRLVAAFLYILPLLVVLRIVGFRVSGVLDTFAGFRAVLAVGMVAVWTILGRITATFSMLIRCPYAPAPQIAPDGMKGKALDNLSDTEAEESQGGRTSIPNRRFSQKPRRRRPLPVPATIMLSPPRRAAVVGGEERGPGVRAWRACAGVA